MLRNETTADGKPLKIVRVPMAIPFYYEIDEGDYLHEVWQETALEMADGLPDGTPFPTGKMTVLPAMSYCNFLITNGLVVGQKFWKEGIDEAVRERDAEALEILKSCFPDREVVQINTIPLNLLGGGIHCGTRQIPA